MQLQAAAGHRTLARCASGVRAHGAARFLAVAAMLYAGSGAAHTGTPGGPDFHWNFDPWVVSLLGLAAASYAAGTVRLWARAGPGRGIGTGQAGAFAAGWLVTAIALVSPLDAFGSRSLSAHMVQHELLMLLAAPLLVASRPLQAWTWSVGPAGRRALGATARWRWLRAPWRRLSAPLPAWLLHAAAIWIWHAPALFQAALANDTLHTLQHTSFLGAALLFWWSILGRLVQGAGHGAAAASLFTTMLHTGALGALLTFSASLWYPSYAGQQLALSAHEDQHLAGLIMWIPGGFVYMAAALAVLGHWLGRAVRAPASPQAGVRLRNRRWPGARRVPGSVRAQPGRERGA